MGQFLRGLSIWLVRLIVLSSGSQRLEGEGEPHTHLKESILCKYEKKRTSDQIKSVTIMVKVTNFVFYTTPRVPHKVEL